MPANCSAVKCRNRWSKEINRSFYLFPKFDMELSKKWVANMKRDAWTPTKHSYLCSDHFLEKMFRYNNDRRSLMPNAVPTLFNFPDDLTTKTTSVPTANQAVEESQCRPVKDVSEPSAETPLASDYVPPRSCNIGDSSAAANVQTTPVSRDVRPCLNSSDLQSPSQSSRDVRPSSTSSDLQTPSQSSRGVRPSLTSSDLQAPSHVQPSSTSPPTLTSTTPLHIQLRSISHDHCFILPSPRKLKKLYDDRAAKCIHLRKSLRVARQDAARQRVKCAKLKKATYDLNQRLIEAVDQINAKPETHVDGLLKELLDCQKSNQYPESVKTFARTLKGYSLRAYKLVGKVIKLPHLRTLRHWAAVEEKQRGLAEETTGSFTVS